MTEIADRLIRKRELESICGLTERQLRRLEDAGRFPKRVVIDPDGRAVAWSEREVRGWVAERLANRERVTEPAAA